jgi:hypothetical protein
VKIGWFIDQSDRLSQGRPWLKTGCLTNDDDDDDDDKLVAGSRFPIKNLTVIKNMKMFEAFYGTRQYITEFTTARYWTASTADRIQINSDINFKIHCHIIFLRFQIGSWKRRDTEPNGSEHSRNLICSSFALQCNFDLLLSVPDIWILLIFKGFISYVLLNGMFWEVFQESVLHFLLYSWQIHVSRNHWIVL